MFCPAAQVFTQKVALLHNQPLYTVFFLIAVRENWNPNLTQIYEDINLVHDTLSSPACCDPRVEDSLFASSFGHCCWKMARFSKTTPFPTPARVPMHFSRLAIPQTKLPLFQKYFMILCTFSKHFTNYHEISQLQTVKIPCDGVQLLVVLIGLLLALPVTVLSVLRSIYA